MAIGGLWDDWWILIAAAVPLLYVLGLLGVPLFILLTFRTTSNPVLVPVEDDVTLPEIVSDYFAEITARMSQIDFETSATLFLPQQVDNITAIVRLFDNERERDTAMATSIYSTIGGNWQIQTQYLEFNTDYEDSTEVDTGNSGRVGAFPLPPHQTVTMAPSLDDPSELYEAHRSICKLVAGQTTKQWRLHSHFHGDAAAELADGIGRELERARQVGYLRYCSEADDKPPENDGVKQRGGEMKATLKGAYLMTWNETWPFKQIITRSHLRRSRQRLEQAGVQLK